MTAPPLEALRIESLTVSFGVFKALDALSLGVRYGAVHAVIGPNGAGKTTLLDVLSGITRPTRGTVLFDGAFDIARASESAIARAGVRRKFQKPSIFEGLSVREHVVIGARAGFARAADEAAMARRVDAILATIGLAEQGARPAAELAHGQKQWLEIGTVLASDPKVVLLDEPVAGLTDEETERTVNLVRDLARPDRAIVVVEHDMDFVERVADHVTVLHEGRTLFEGSMADVRGDGRVIDVYLGR